VIRGGIAEVDRRTGAGHVPHGMRSQLQLGRADVACARATALYTRQGVGVSDETTVASESSSLLSKHVVHVCALRATASASEIGANHKPNTT
jgi:hypothetical protein